MNTATTTSPRTDRTARIAQLVGNGAAVILWIGFGSILAGLFAAAATMDTDASSIVASIFGYIIGITALAFLTLVASAKILKALNRF